MQCLSRAPGWRIIRHGRMALVGIALALPLVSASAQTGTIVGTITDQATKAPIASVQVQIVGTTRGVISGQDGHYRVAVVPSGPTQLRVSRIGYAAATQTVTVPTGDVVTADFALTATNITLDQVVVTGTQTGERERETGNLVAVIPTDSINKGAVQTFSDLIAGKAAGVEIGQSSGEVGANSRIRIRGNNSVSLTNDPLLIIDGVYVNNSSQSLSSNLFTGGQIPSRFDDLNPDEIENVEVLKGPSAAALYGTAGANGVILVTTKKGSAGRAVWTAHTDFGGVYEASVFQSNFGQAGTILVGSRAGTPAVNGLGNDDCTLVAQATGFCAKADSGLQNWNPLMSSLYNPFTTGNARYQFGASVAGGSESTKYFVSGDYSNEHGVQANSYQTKNNGRANIQATPSSSTDFSINAGYLQSRLALPSNDNNEASTIAAGQLGAPVNNARHGYFVLITPAQSNSIITSQDVERFTGGATGNWRPAGWLTLTGVTGLDVTNRGDFQLLPIGAEASFSTNAGSGFVTSNPVQTDVYTAQFNGSAQFNVSASIHGTSTVGTQYTNSVFRETQASGFGLISGTGSVAGTTNQFAASQTGNNQVVDIGYYAQQQFGWRDKVFVTAALRLDDNSSFGQVYKPSYYPSVSSSWVVGEEPWFPKGAVLSSLRLRGAFGFSGQHPGFQQAQTFFNTVTANLAAQSGEVSGVTLGGIGNAGLKAERSGEFEGGFDAGFWHDRLNFQATGYSKSTTDALVAVNLAPTVGGVTIGPVAGTSTRFENLGQVDNRGMELSLTANLIQGRNTRFDLTINESYNRNKVITLGPGIAPIQFNSVNTGPNIQRIQAGYPIGAFFQPSYTYSDANHDGIIDPSEVTVSSVSTFQGNRDPAQLFSINPQLTIFKYFKISTLFDRQSDVSALNFSATFRCSEFNNCQWDYDPHTSLRNQAKVAADLDGTDLGYLEDASFWKWRELSVRASAPDSWVRRLKVAALSFTVAGRNLRTWTKYTGVDPEVNSSPNVGGAASFAQSEFFTQGLVRFWTGRIDLTF
jgi:TonB-dependent starch-binding outer membrane protein SusC